MPIAIDIFELTILLNFTYLVIIYIGFILLILSFPVRASFILIYVLIYTTMLIFSFNLCYLFQYLSLILRNTVCIYSILIIFISILIF
jgi:hypothetical protein